MKPTKKNTEGKIREKLDAYEFDPTPDMWAGMEQLLDQQAVTDQLNTPPGPSFWKAAPTWSLLLGLLLSIFTLNSWWPTQQTPTTAFQSSPQPERRANSAEVSLLPSISPARLVVPDQSAPSISFRTPEVNPPSQETAKVIQPSTQALTSKPKVIDLPLLSRPFPERLSFAGRSIPMADSLILLEEQSKTAPLAAYKSQLPIKEIEPQTFTSQRIYFGLGFSVGQANYQGNQSIGDLRLRIQSRPHLLKLHTMAFIHLHRNIRLQTSMAYFQTNLDYEARATLGGDPFFAEASMQVRSLEIPLSLHIYPTQQFRLSAGLGWQFNWARASEPINYPSNINYEQFVNNVANSYQRSVPFYDLGIGIDWHRFSFDLRRRVSMQSFLDELPYQTEQFSYSSKNSQWFLSVSYLFAP